MKKCPQSVFSILETSVFSSIFKTTVAEKLTFAVDFVEIGNVYVGIKMII